MRADPSGAAGRIEGQTAGREAGELSLAAMVARHKTPVYLLALRMTGNREDAEDIAQETFLRAFRHLDRLDPERGPRAWLLKVATRLCFNHHRSKKRRWRAMRDLAETISLSRTGEAEAPDDGMLRALGQLRPDWRAAVSLVWLEGMGHREAAGILGCSEGTVSWRIFKAREELRRILAPLLEAGDDARKGATRP